MIMAEDIERECTGRWLGIFSHFGISVPLPPGQHGFCPICSNGDSDSDRFRLDRDTTRGSWFCNQCEPRAGYGTHLVQHYFGLDFPSTLKKIGEIVGMVEKEDIKEPIDDILLRKKNLNKLWTSSSKLSGSDPVSIYLHSRKMNLTPDNVRYCPKCYESDSKTELPAMVAMVMNKAGKPISMHRTYLCDEGKADIKSPKKMMPGLENLSGGAIRLFQPGEMFENDSIGVAEGIETAISASQMFMVATWACISNTVLESFDPPEGIKKVVIFADNDANYIGQASAYLLAKKLYSKDLIVSVVVPNLPDFNDELSEGMATEIR